MGQDSKPHSAKPPVSEWEDDYAKFVEGCRKKRSSTIITNTSTQHARIVIRNLLLLAAEEKASIQLLSGSLDQSVYNSLAHDLNDAVASGCSLRVMTDGGQPRRDENPFFDAILCSGSETYRFHGGEEGPRPSVRHFLVVGDLGYRFEFDHRTKAASACFHDEGKIVTGVLAARFEELWGQARALLRNR